MKTCHAEWARQRALKSGVHNYLVFSGMCSCSESCLTPSASKELLLFPAYRMEKSSHSLVHSYKWVYKSQRKQLIISPLYNSEKEWSCREQFFQEFRMSSQHKVEFPLPNTYLPINVGLFLLLVIVTNTATNIQEEL